MSAWLLVIRYEALFYIALGLVLLAWILVESVVCHSVVPSPSPKWERSNSNYLPEPTGIQSSKAAALCSIELQHTRVALCFVSLFPCILWCQ